MAEEASAFEEFEPYPKWFQYVCILTPHSHKIHFNTMIKSLDTIHLQWRFSDTALFGLISYWVGFFLEDTDKLQTPKCF